MQPKSCIPVSHLNRFRKLKMTKNCTVLVVEDEPLIRMDLVDQLQRKGCCTLEASSAAEAILILNERSDVTVVFTDIQMPGTMDGIQLAQYVRERFPPTIVVVSSGKIVPPPNALADDVAFLTKPYDDQKLSSIIADVRSRLAMSHTC
jgi:two-component system, response regulator PdtaR